MCNLLYKNSGVPWPVDQCQSVLSQGCPIGIPKNPEVSGSSRKSSFGAREIPRVSKVQWGRGVGVVAEPSKEKSVDSPKNHFLVRRICLPRVSKVQWGWGRGVVDEP